MPIYVYRDEETGFEKEVLHSITETEKPSTKTLLEITHEGRIMTRVPQAVAVSTLPTARGGKVDPVKAAKAREVAKKRSNEHFNKNIKEQKEAIGKDIINQFKGN